MLTRIFMNNEYLIFYVLFSLYHLSSPGSMISLMFFDGRASSGLARCVDVLNESHSTFSMGLVLPVRKHNKKGTKLRFFGTYETKFN